MNTNTALTDKRYNQLAFELNDWIDETFPNVDTLPGDSTSRMIDRDDHLICITREDDIMIGVYTAADWEDTGEPSVMFFIGIDKPDVAIRLIDALTDEADVVAGARTLASVHSRLDTGVTAEVL